jgi:hypothetical protein
MNQNSTQETKRSRSILFLDFDGVLNTDATLARIPHPSFPGGHMGLEEEQISRLNAILDATDAAIVFSTSWRTEYSTEKLCEFLEEKGFRHSSRVVGMTPRRFSSNRGSEIASWLRENCGRGQSFVILDDIPTHMQANQILTSETFGLRETDVAIAIEILTNGPTWRDSSEEDDTDA